MEKSRRDDWKTIEPDSGSGSKVPVVPTGLFVAPNLYPGLTSWAKFSRPFGTEVRGEVLT